MVLFTLQTGWTAGDTKRLRRSVKLDVLANKNDLKAERKETERLITWGRITDQCADELINSYFHIPDMGIAKKAVRIGKIREIRAKKHLP